MQIRVVLALALTSPSVGFANLMTFDALPHEGAQLTTWVEDGITATATGGILAFHDLPTQPNGMAHLDGWGTGFARRVDFTTGSAFIADSVGIQPLGSSFCGAVPCHSGHEPFPYIVVTGYLENILMGSMQLYRSASSTTEMISLLSLGTIDRLTIGVNGTLIAGTFGEIIDGGYCGYDHGCGHFNIDSLLLTPVSVPEPATIGLLLSGLAGIGFARRRRRS